MQRFEIEEGELLESLIETIRSLPDARARIESREVALGPRLRADAIIHTEIGGYPLNLLVEAKRSAFPRDVREVAWQLRNYLAHMPNDENFVPFFVSPAISPGARDILRDEGIGFHDLGGSLFLPAKHAYIYIDRPAPKNNVKAFDAIFQGQKARVLYAVFERQQDWLTVKDLAHATGVSAATTSETLTEMERREWVDVDGGGPTKVRRLRSPRPLIEAWAAFIGRQKPPRIERYYVACDTAEEIAHRLDRACKETGATYAVTSEVAAQLYAPHLSSLSQLRCRIAPGGRQEDALSLMKARHVDEGWNLGVIESRGAKDIVPGDRVDDISLAPALQVYLDLLQGPGRSKEMAQHLYDTRLMAR